MINFRVPLRFDESKKQLTVSVRELADDSGVHRAGFERGESWNRLGLGTEIHSQISQKRCAENADYRCEIHLETELVFGEWTALITGRLDGCLQQKNGAWLIEEFKSAYSPYAHISPFGRNFEKHRQQLLIYCHLWQLRGHSPVSGALVYVDIATGKEFTSEIAYDATAQKKKSKHDSTDFSPLGKPKKLFANRRRASPRRFRFRTKPRAPVRRD